MFTNCDYGYGEIIHTQSNHQWEKRIPLPESSLWENKLSWDTIKKKGVLSGRDTSHDHLNKVHNKAKIRYYFSNKIPLDSVISFLKV